MLTPVSGEFHDLQCFHAAGQIHIRGSRSPGGMTADEIGEKLVSEGKIPTNSPNFTRPRLTEMKAEGKVVIVGRRPGKSGCNTAVWKVKR